MDACVFPQKDPWIFLHRGVQLLVYRNCFELNIKLCKVRIKGKKVVIVSVAFVFLTNFSWDIFTLFVSLLNLGCLCRVILHQFLRGKNFLKIL